MKELIFLIKDDPGGGYFAEAIGESILTEANTLETLKKDGQNVTVYTDSQYVAHAIEKGWLFGWEKKKFHKKKNPDLWERFLKVYRRHKVKFVWIRGHSSHKENNYCDKLAVDAA